MEHPRLKGLHEEGIKYSKVMRLEFVFVSLSIRLTE